MADGVGGGATESPPNGEDPEEIVGGGGETVGLGGATEGVDCETAAAGMEMGGVVIPKAFNILVRN